MTHVCSCRGDLDYIIVYVPEDLEFAKEFKQILKNNGFTGVGGLYTEFLKTKTPIEFTIRNEAYRLVSNTKLKFFIITRNINKDNMEAFETFKRMAEYNDAVEKRSHVIPIFFDSVKYLSEEGVNFLPSIIELLGVWACDPVGISDIRTLHLPRLKTITENESLTG